MTVLNRAAELLREHTGRSAFDGYQDKNRKRAWEQVAAIYKAVGELGIRYIVAPASFENTGQKVRSPADILSQRFGNCLDLSLLFSACCEQVGLHPLVLMHESHAYAGCWLEERTLAEPSSDDLQHIRKLATDELITAFECTVVASETPGTLKDAELMARPHFEPRPSVLRWMFAGPAWPEFIRCRFPVSRANWPAPWRDSQPVPGPASANVSLLPLGNSAESAAKPATRIDQWKSRLLDLSLRNRLLNFRETKSTIRILSTSPDRIEDELAAERELSLRPKPKVMGEDDPRNETTYTQQQRADALADHLPTNSNMAGCILILRI